MIDASRGLRHGATLPITRSLDIDIVGVEFFPFDISFSFSSRVA
jgi:hypothetical protein